MKEKIKQIIDTKQFHICMVILIIVAILCTVGLITLKYNVEGENNLPFELSKITVISTIEGNDNEDANNKWNLTVNQNNDIYLYIKKNENYKTTEAIQSITLNNFNQEQTAKIGERKIYKPDANIESVIFKNAEENNTQKIEYNGALDSSIKEVINIPVITVGRFTEPQYADIMVKQGRADLVSFGRQSLADPETPNKARDGKLELMTPCIACLQGCVPNMFQGKPITCLANPFLGREGELTMAKESKSVLVIGGGLGGMQAAWVSALRGHKVTLVEKSYTLGGQMRLAAYPPGKGDITNLVRNFIARCDEYGVKVLLNTEATEELVKEMNPDVCIVATGATPLVLPIPGINDVGVINAIDLLDGQKACGTKVLVVGGGMVGAETAEFLAEQEHEVSIIEFKDKIAGDVAKEHRKYIMEAFDRHNVESITGAKVAEFYTDGVKYELADGSVHEVRGFDSVVLAMGSRNYDPISESLKDIVKETYVIGDAVRARRALNATAEALDVALSI